MNSGLEIGESYNYPLIINKLFDTAIRNLSRAEIVHCDNSRYGYPQLAKRVNQLANTLSSLGVTDSDTVAVIDYDSPRFLSCFFAIPMMGAVLQTINWRLSPEQIKYMINHTKASTIIVHADFFSLVEALISDLDHVKTIIPICENGEIETPLNVTKNMEVLLSEASDQFYFKDFDENKKATTFYTSGTTGNPKGVYFSHRQLVMHTMSISLSLSAFKSIITFDSSDTYMPLTAMFHVHAWGFPYIATFLGAKQVYPGKYDPETILKLIEKEGVTVSHCVPTILQMILEHPYSKKVDLSNWKIIMGGAQLSEGLAKEAQSRGITLHSSYGMSETGPVMVLAQPKQHMTDWDDKAQMSIILKTGRPVAMARVEVLDPEGNFLPHDGKSVGEVVMQAPWMTHAYYEDTERTKELWKNGWLHSGDIGYIDEEGYLQITDRIKDIIKTGGEWISSLEIEQCLSQHESVLESAAVGVHHDKWGERPVAAIGLNPDKEQINEQELKTFMLKFVEDGKLSKYALPDRYEFMEIPKTSVGKIDKKRLRIMLNK
ncbi:MAG: fatty acid--CoA ligase [Flavobacteriales bacterium]|nr:fatty acid--CoA ligase [Flavobacteriales bacterium]